MDSTNEKINNKIRDNKIKWAKDIMNLHYEIQPELEKKYSNKDEEHFIEDIKHHLSYLAETILLDSISLFEDYINWTNSLLNNLGIPTESLITNLKCIKKTLVKKLNNKEIKLVNKYI